MSFLSPENLGASHLRPVSLGRISLVGAGPGATDLLTLRAVNRLRAADVVFFDRLVELEILDFAPAHAERIFVGKEVGAHSWPQGRIDAAITAAALQGKKVVRLKSGDPSIFGRAAEELAAARRYGIEVEIIPGITAASAAAASHCQPLTERGKTERLVLATATDCSGALPKGTAHCLQPGASVVFYMAMHNLQALQTEFRQANLGEDHPLTIISNVSKASQRILQTTVGTLIKDCMANKLKNPAVIMISIPSDVGKSGNTRGYIPSNAAGKQCVDHTSLA